MYGFTFFSFLHLKLILGWEDTMRPNLRERMTEMKAVHWSFQRIEEKYLLTSQQYDRLRAALNGRIEPDEYPRSTICNIYYDTPDYLLIRRSLDKPLYKGRKIIFDILRRHTVPFAFRAFHNIWTIYIVLLPCRFSL